MQKVTAKHNRNENNIKSFNINRINNVKKFDKLLKIIKKIEAKGYKSNLNQSKKYKDNLYFSVYDKHDTIKVKQGDRYELKISFLEPNNKNFCNIKILSYKGEAPKVMEFDTDSEPEPMPEDSDEFDSDN